LPVIDFSQAHELAKLHGTPLLVVSQEKLRSNVGELQSSLPGVRLYYAVKANPDDEVLKILSHESVGFDVSSVEREE
jgi:ornithine decarboxylase